MQYVIYAFHPRIIKKALHNICCKEEYWAWWIENHVLKLYLMSWKYINNIRSSGKNTFQKALPMDQSQFYKQTNKNFKNYYSFSHNILWEHSNPTEKASFYMIYSYIAFWSNNLCFILRILEVYCLSSQESERRWNMNSNLGFTI